MSFPHRTAFYNKETKEIEPPDSGLAFYRGSNGWDIYDVLQDKRVGAKYIPLTSTGLQDSEGDEVFEGHLVSLWDFKFIIGWELGSKTGCFYGYCLDGNKDGHIVSMKHGKIIDHALTEPNLVPDSFDIEDYFNLQPSEEK